MKNLIILAAIGMFFSSCFSVDFIAPQPADVENQEVFPARLLGTYLVENDTAWAYPNSFKVLDKTIEEVIPLAEAKADSDLIFKGDLLYDKKIGADIPLSYTIKDEVVFYKYLKYDEHFLNDTSVVLRKFKKYWVLNLREGLKWQVLLITPQKDGNLTLSTINDDSYDDGRAFQSDSLIKKIESICRVRHISENSYMVHPSKKEFKQLINKGIFRPVNIAKRISTDTEG